jgi:hypothetical protein
VNNHPAKITETPVAIRGLGGRKAELEFQFSPTLISANHPSETLMERKNVSSLWRVTAVLIGIFATSVAWKNYQIYRAKQNAFDYTCLVTVVDADTGKILPPKIAFPPSSASDLIGESTSSSLAQGGMLLSGRAYVPQIFRVTSKGYDEETLTIQPGSPSHAEVRIIAKQ